MASMVGLFFQQMTKTVRDITPFELENIDARMVGAGSWQEFRDWLLLVIGLINEHKLQKFWDKGFIVGFLGGEKSAQVLAGEEAGVFLIRFSDSVNKGELSIDYSTGKTIAQSSTGIGEATASGSGLKSITLTSADLKLENLPERLRSMEFLNKVYGGSNQKSNLTAKDDAFPCIELGNMGTTWSSLFKPKQTQQDLEHERREIEKLQVEFESFLKEVLTKD